MTTCKLCLKSVQEVGPLQQSHIIPRFIFRRSKSKRGRMLTFNEQTGKLALSQADWKENMLCKHCELLIKTNYEDFIQEVLYLRRKRPAIHADHNLVLLFANTNQLALALLSIFWRAAISTYPAFQYPVAPDYVLEEMRQWLHAKKIDRNWHKRITIKIQEIKTNSGARVAFLMPPFYRKDALQFEFVFICGGFLFSFAFPPPPYLVLTRAKRLRPHSWIVRFEKIHFAEVPELKNAVDAMLLADVPSLVRKEIDAKA